MDPAVAFTAPRTPGSHAPGQYFDAANYYDDPVQTLLLHCLLTKPSAGKKLDNFLAICNLTVFVTETHMSEFRDNGLLSHGCGVLGALYL